jgi:hypothetical protein
MERRGCVVEPKSMGNQQWEEPVTDAKPFVISKWEVLEASTYL